MALHRHLRQAIAALSTFPMIEFRLGPLKDSLFRTCRAHGGSSSEKRDDAAPLVTSARYVRVVMPSSIAGSGNLHFPRTGKYRFRFTGLLRRQARLTEVRVLHEHN